MCVAYPCTRLRASKYADACTLVMRDVWCSVRDAWCLVAWCLVACRSLAGHTYWLYKGEDDDVVRLYDLTVREQHSPCPLCTYMCLLDDAAGQRRYMYMRACLGRGGGNTKEGDERATVGSGRLRVAAVG